MPVRDKHLRLAAALLTLAAVFFAGCATQRVVGSAHIAQASATIKAAEALGADKVPIALTHLRYAREQATEAERLLANGRDGDASLLFERAEVDAQLALALTREAALRADAARARQHAAELDAAERRTP